MSRNLQGDEMDAFEVLTEQEWFEAQMARGLQDVADRAARQGTPCDQDGPVKVLFFEDAQEYARWLALANAVI